MASCCIDGKRPQDHWTGWPHFDWIMKYPLFLNRLWSSMLQTIQRLYSWHSNGIFTTPKSKWSLLTPKPVRAGDFMAYDHSHHPSSQCKGKPWHCQMVFTYPSTELNNSETCHQTNGLQASHHKLKSERAQQGFSTSNRGPHWLSYPHLESHRGKKL